MQNVRSRYGNKPIEGLTSSQLGHVLESLFDSIYKSGALDKVISAGKSKSKSGSLTPGFQSHLDSAEETPLLKKPKAMISKYSPLNPKRGPGRTFVLPNLHAQNVKDTQKPQVFVDNRLLNEENFARTESGGQLKKSNSEYLERRKLEPSSITQFQKVQTFNHPAFHKHTDSLLPSGPSAFKSASRNNNMQQLTKGFRTKGVVLKPVSRNHLHIQIPQSKFSSIRGHQSTDRIFLEALQLAQKALSKKAESLQNQNHLRYIKHKTKDGQRKKGPSLGKRTKKINGNHQKKSKSLKRTSKKKQKPRKTFSQEELFKKFQNYILRGILKSHFSHERQLQNDNNFKRRVLKHKHRNLTIRPSNEKYIKIVKHKLRPKEKAAFQIPKNNTVGKKHVIQKLIALFRTHPFSQNQSRLSAGVGDARTQTVRTRSSTFAPLVLAAKKNISLFGGHPSPFKNKIRSKNRSSLVFLEKRSGIRKEHNYLSFFNSTPEVTYATKISSMFSSKCGGHL